MEKCHLHGYVTEKGVLHIQNRRRMEEWANKNPGKQVVIKIERRGVKRSTQQNRYLWGVVYEEVRLGFLNIGYEMTSEQTHEWLKEKFNSIQVENKQGVMIDMPGTTTQLTKTGFSEYIEKIARFAAEYLGVVIPAPNEHLEMKFE